LTFTKIYDLSKRIPLQWQGGKGGMQAKLANLAINVV
jgi:hypothetical protein